MDMMFSRFSYNATAAGTLRAHPMLSTPAQDLSDVRQQPQLPVPASAICNLLIHPDTIFVTGVRA
jgi:hypothetical protein